MKNTLKKCLITAAVATGVILTSASSFAWWGGYGPGYYNGGYHRAYYYNRPYYRPYYHTYYNYNRCGWVPGHWRGGYWVPAHRACW